MSIEAVLVAATPSPELDRQLRDLAARRLVVHRLRGHGGSAQQRAVEALWLQHGIRAGGILAVDACGACALPTSVTRLLPAEAPRVLADLLATRSRGDLPSTPDDGEWIVEVRGADPTAERMHDTWLAMVDGLVGTTGSPLTSYAPARRQVRIAGVYTGSGPDSDLLRAPDWTRLDGELVHGEHMRRVLDLRSGLLYHEAQSTRGAFRALTFASRALPGVGALRAIGEGARPPRGMVLAGDPTHEGTITDVPGHADTAETGVVAGVPGGVAVAASQELRGRSGERRLERLAAYVPSGVRPPAVTAARARLAQAERIGFDGLLLGQRSAWAARWREMGIRIEGDPDLQRAVNFALFHLDASVAGQREAPLGPRGLSGPSYKGHVFWDSEVFMLPFFAATRPAAARAILAYRANRLGAAQAAAREAGLRGAWYPWESAANGRDVTPPWVPGPTAQPIRVWTGERELHIPADVAWAAAAYVAWTGDRGFAAGDGRRLLIETARYWASRLERDPDGTVHLRGIIGPDEYHELVDDNVYTNVMARWNLRAAAAAVAAWPAGADEGTGGDHRALVVEPAPEEVADWLDVASRIVDGYDARTGLYEQFRGFFELEDVRIADLAPRPAWADVLLGRERVAQAQVIKQADVLMLHHLVPEEVAPGSLASNLAYYEPRTAHGSSLSPATHATLLARLAKHDAALDALRMAAFLDLDDRNGTASEGLHIQTMGGLWQALAMGFAGIRPTAEALEVDPRLPPQWERLEVPVRFHGRRVDVIVTRDALRLRGGGEVPVRVPGHEPLHIGRRWTEITLQDGRPAA